MQSPELTSDCVWPRPLEQQCHSCHIRPVLGTRHLQVGISDGLCRFSTVYVGTARCCHKACNTCSSAQGATGFRQVPLSKLLPSSVRFAAAMPAEVGWTITFVADIAPYPTLLIRATSRHQDKTPRDLATASTTMLRELRLPSTPSVGTPRQASQTHRDGFSVTSLSNR